MDSVVKPHGRTNLKLRQLTRIVSRHFDPYIESAGLRSAQYYLLTHVVLFGAMRPSDLARHMHMDASTITRNLQPLVAQGWVVIGPGKDARSRLVEPTPAGRAKRTEGHLAWKRAQAALKARLGAERVDALYALLDECIELADGSLEDPASE